MPNESAQMYATLFAPTNWLNDWQLVKRKT